MALSTLSADEPAAKEEKKEEAKPAVKEVPAKKKVDMKAMQAAQQQEVRKHYLRQYRPIMLAELDRIRLAGDVPIEKRSLIKKAGEDEVEKIVDALLKPAGQPAVQRLLFNLPVPARQPVIDPYQRIGKAIDKAAGDHLSAEHVARYREGRAHREESRKQATIKLVVFRIDAMLRLSSKQRADLVTELNKQWKPDWIHWMGMAQYGGDVVPSVPSTLIEPILSPAQVKVWKGLQKMDSAQMSIQRWNAAENIGWNLGPRDDYWGKEPEAEKPAEAMAVPVPAGG